MKNKMITLCIVHLLFCNTHDVAPHGQNSNTRNMPDLFDFGVEVGEQILQLYLAISTVD